MQPNPILVRLGPISIYWYGVLIVGGAMLATHIEGKLPVSVAPRFQEFERISR